MSRPSWRIVLGVFVLILLLVPLFGVLAIVYHVFHFNVLLWALFLANNGIVGEYGAHRFRKAEMQEAVMRTAWENQARSSARHVYERGYHEGYERARQRSPEQAEQLFDERMRFAEERARLAEQERLSERRKDFA
jgi:hypothetical protein